MSKTIEDIYTMKLHDELYKPSQNYDILIIRVAGGWLYINKILDQATGYAYLGAQTFVPYNNEFMQSEVFDAEFNQPIIDRLQKEIEDLKKQLSFYKNGLQIKEIHYYEPLFQNKKQMPMPPIKFV